MAVNFYSDDKFMLCVLVLCLPIYTCGLHVVHGGLGPSRNWSSEERPSAGSVSSEEVIEESVETENADEITNEVGEVAVEEKHECNRVCTKDSQPKTCRYEFKVEWYQTMSKACYECPFNGSHCGLLHCIPADGVKRPVLVVNRQMPGPAIEVCLGDTVEVEVENLLYDESTSVHWHGHHQKGTPYMDGVPYVTQCPIHPKAKFLYRYTANTPGTHFWHSHSALQRGDGMYGSLVVRVPLSEDPHFDLFDLDLSEHVMVITDWTHTVGLTKFIAHHHSDGDNKPTNILVNGKGRYQEFEDEFGTVLQTPVEIFKVEQGLRYRFRIINAGFLNCPIAISIDNHTLVVVSSDGGDVEPIEADSLVTYAGERFDIIVEMNQDVGNYWMRFMGLMDCDERFTSAHQVAVLRYEGADEEDPLDEVAYEAGPRDGVQVNSLNTGSGTNGSVTAPEFQALASSKDPRLKPEADQKFFISYDFYPKDNTQFHLAGSYGFHQIPDKKQRLFTPQLNHISMRLPAFPLLSDREASRRHDFCNSSTVEKDCDVKYCECTHVLRIPLNNVVEMILVDKGFTFDANHPFHLHGYGFRVVGMERIGKNVTVEEVQRLDQQGLLRRNLKDSPVKDTVTVPDGGYTVLRWQASNPGYWLFHCHIEYHVELGMSIIFKVGEDSDYPPVPRNFPRCSDYTPQATTLSSFQYKNYNKSDAVEIDFEGLEPQTRLKSARGNCTRISMSKVLLIFVAVLFQWFSRQAS